MSSGDHTHTSTYRFSRLRGRVPTILLPLLIFAGTAALYQGCTFYEKGKANAASSSSSSASAAANSGLASTFSDPLLSPVSRSASRRSYASSSSASSSSSPAKQVVRRRVVRSDGSPVAMKRYNITSGQSSASTAKASIPKPVTPAPATKIESWSARDEMVREALFSSGTASAGLPVIAPPPTVTRTTASSASSSSFASSGSSGSPTSMGPIGSPSPASLSIASKSSTVSGPVLPTRTETGTSSSRSVSWSQNESLSQPVRRGNLTRTWTSAPASRSGSSWTDRALSASVASHSTLDYSSHGASPAHSTSVSSEPPQFVDGVPLAKTYPIGAPLPDAGMPPANPPVVVRHSPEPITVSEPAPFRYESASSSFAAETYAPAEPYTPAPSQGGGITYEPITSTLESASPRIRPRREGSGLNGRRISITPTLDSDPSLATVEREYDDELGGEIHRVKTTKEGLYPDQVRFRVSNRETIQRGENLTVYTMARNTNAGEVQVPLLVHGQARSDVLDRKPLLIDETWRPHYHAFRADRDFQPGELNVSFQTGGAATELQFGTLELVSTGIDAAILPQSSVSYEGRANSADWRAQADDQIDRLRKEDITLIIKDARGRPLANAPVDVYLKEHDFHFGVGVDKAILTGPKDREGEGYRSVLQLFFNSATIRNGLNWKQWENNPEALKDDTVDAIDWLRERGFQVRGTSLVWPIFGVQNPDGIDQLDGNKLRGRINNHIGEIVPTLRGRVDEWDVVTNARAGQEFINKVGAGETANWFRLAQQKDGSAKLFLNEYGILNGSEENLKKLEALVRDLNKSNVPISGIGLQAHFDDRLPSPAELTRILDRVAQLGHHIHITEFDVAIHDEAAQADFTFDFYHAMLAHPKVTGVTTWNLWEPRAWPRSTAYFREDWSYKPNGVVLARLLDRKKGLWTTRKSLTTDAQGKVSFRGFRGEYEAAANIGGKSEIRAFTLQKGYRDVQLSFAPGAKPKAVPAVKPKAVPAAKPKAVPAAKPKPVPAAKPKSTSAAKPLTLPIPVPKPKAIPAPKPIPSTATKSSARPAPRSIPTRAGPQTTPPKSTSIKRPTAPTPRVVPAPKRPVPSAIKPTTRPTPQKTSVVRPMPKKAVPPKTSAALPKPKRLVPPKTSAALPKPKASLPPSVAELFNSPKPRKVTPITKPTSSVVKPLSPASAATLPKPRTTTPVRPIIRPSSSPSKTSKAPVTMPKLTPPAVKRVPVRPIRPSVTKPASDALPKPTLPVRPIRSTATPSPVSAPILKPPPIPSTGSGAAIPSRPGPSAIPRRPGPSSRN